MCSSDCEAAYSLVSEVGPRDGLQSVKAVMPTADKIRWITALHAAGLREIEVASFVPARLLPQMADAAEVVRHALTLPGLTVMALVPNLRGAQAALAAGVHKLTIPCSASAAHSLANVRMTREQMIATVREIVALRNDIAPQVKIEAGISTAFGCTLQGEVPEDDVVWMAAQAIAAGADESGLSDTTGMANPAQVRRLFNRVRAEIGDRTGAAHMHNTRGLGLANCLAAYDVGVRTFDASLGGLGGCPYAPGASGNVVTEDLVFMFEAMGVHRHRSRETDRSARAAAGRAAGRAGLRHGAGGRPAASDGSSARSRGMSEQTSHCPTRASASSNSPTW
jgi:hydroxymethylglutaryl-CoA lyase